MRRYVIVGAGAIGGGIGARLVQAGLPTVLIARGEHLAAMQRDGLRLRTPREDVTLPVTAVGSIADVTLGSDDVILLSTKTQQVLDVLPAVADAPVHAEDGTVIGTAGDLLPVFLATNGVSAEGLAARYVRRVFGVCIWMPAVHLEPGEVIIRGVPMSGILHLGRVPAELTGPADHALLAEVAADWRRATFDIALPADVMAWKHRKLISNLANVVDALVDDPRAARPVTAAADAEARAVLTAAMVPVVDDATEAAARAQGFTIEPVPGLEDARLGSSSWQSLSRGTGSIETDYLNGEIVRIAHQHGRPAPVNARLARLARAAISDGGGPGSVSAAELAEAVGDPNAD
jgi:2-dehydropantoate 2-reductase